MGQVNKALAPLYVGFTVCMIGLSYGYNTGFAINPARDLSPRLLSYAVGYKEVFSLHDYGYWWIPVIGPHVGAILGTFLYYFFMELHWPDEEDIVEIDERKKKIPDFVSPIKRNVKLQAEMAEAELKLMRE